MKKTNLMTVLAMLFFATIFSQPLLREVNGVNLNSNHNNYTEHTEYTVYGMLVNSIEGLQVTTPNETVDYNLAIDTDGGVNCNLNQVDRIFNALVDDASFSFVPSGINGSKLYVQIPKLPLKFFSVSRDDKSTYANEDKILKLNEINVASVDFHDYEGVGGLLLQKGVWNMMPNSRLGMTQSMGIDNQTQETPFGAAAVRDGYQLNLTSSDSRFRFDMPSDRFEDGQHINISWYARKLEPVLVNQVGHGTMSPFLNCTLVGETKQIGWDINGFDRFEQTLAITNGANYAMMNFLVHDVNGTGRAKVCYYGWTATAETHATALIPTNAGGGAHSVSDVISSIDDASIFNSKEGSLLFHGSIQNATTATTGDNFISISDGTHTNSLSLYTVQGNEIVARLTLGSTVRFKLSHVLEDTNDSYKVAVTWESGRAVLYVNGEKVDSSDSVDTGTTDEFNVFRFASPINDLFFYGKIKGVRAFTRSLSDEEMRIESSNP